ncbi:hypothetical protein L9F63_010408, partial [Diploptera punctata]
TRHFRVLMRFFFVLVFVSVFSENTLFCYECRMKTSDCRYNSAKFLSVFAVILVTVFVFDISYSLNRNNLELRLQYIFTAGHSWNVHILYDFEYISSISSSTMGELQLFSLQLLHRKVQFTACGFFPLDFTLLYSIIGAVTTYLVILIQFHLTIHIRNADV